jgi:large subunit ribosomal protein L21
MYAIIESGGKQMRVEVGSKIFVEKLEGEVSSEVVFDKVLLLSGDELKIGAPYVEGSKVTGTITKQDKQKKVIVFRYKAKANQRKKRGHRQPFTLVEITAIA